MPFLCDAFGTLWEWACLTWKWYLFFNATREWEKQNHSFFPPNSCRSESASGERGRGRCARLSLQRVSREPVITTVIFNFSSVILWSVAVKKQEAGRPVCWMACIVIHTDFRGSGLAQLSRGLRGGNSCVDDWEFPSAAHIWAIYQQAQCFNEAWLLVLHVFFYLFIGKCHKTLLMCSFWFCSQTQCSYMMALIKKSFLPGSNKGMSLSVYLTVFLGAIWHLYIARTLWPQIVILATDQR